MRAVITVPRRCRLRTVPAALIVLAALAAGTARAQSVSNPNLFTKSLGAAHQAVSYYGSYNDIEQRSRVNRIGYEVAQQSGFEDFPFSFFLVEMPVPNAFALPGGHIFITRGMLDLGLTDDMLAGLLGHEIAHVVFEHGTKTQKRATLLNVLSNVLMVGVAIAADDSGDRGPPSSVYGDPRYGSGGGDRVMGAAAAGMVVSELLLRSYSRNFEDEADDEGQRMAAAAGYDPDGTRQLMALMQVRLPQTQEYGYWRTHPFFEERVRSADVRQGLLKIQEPESADAYRRRSQEALLGFREQPKLEPELVELLKFSAVMAWPKGPESAEIRMEYLHRLRDRELERPELSRDFGELVSLYQDEVKEVQMEEPDAPLIAVLDREMSGFDVHKKAIYPRALEVYEGGVFETEFLETYVSNFPDAPESAEVAFHLGNAYSRLDRPADAVEQYLKAWASAPESDFGKRARIGLRTLAGLLVRLDALQSLVNQEDDPELQRLARARMDEVVAQFEELENGAEFLRSYPGAPHADAVNERLNRLAENVYGEVILYQTVGDHAKALDGITSILTQAPLSPAAQRLRERAVFDG